jgi:hypothetical protein
MVSVSRQHHLHQPTRQGLMQNNTKKLISFLVLAAVVLVTTRVRLNNHREEMTPQSSGAAEEASGTNDKTQQVSSLRYYKLVDQNEGQGQHFFRYAAYNPDTDAPHTIDEWSTAMLSQGGNISAEQLRTEFFQILKSCPYKAYFFETKSASTKSISDEKFEFVLVDAPELEARAANTGPTLHFFEEPFSKCDPADIMACAFWSLGGDSRLIAPRPIFDEIQDSYMHMAKFMRDASKQQIQETWTLAISEYVTRINNKENAGKPFWLSTDGMGVTWLHIRVDERPKYYSFREFASE